MSIKQLIESSMTEAEVANHLGYSPDAKFYFKLVDTSIDRDVVMNRNHDNDLNTLLHTDDEYIATIPDLDVAKIASYVGGGFSAPVIVMIKESKKYILDTEGHHKYAAAKLRGDLQFPAIVFMFGK